MSPSDFSPFEGGEFHPPRETDEWYEEEDSSSSWPYILAVLFVSACIGMILGWRG